MGRSLLVSGDDFASQSFLKGFAILMMLGEQSIMGWMQSIAPITAADKLTAESPRLICSPES